MTPSDDSTKSLQELQAEATQSIKELLAFIQKMKKPSDA